MSETNEPKKVAEPAGNDANPRRGGGGRKRGSRKKAQPKNSDAKSDSKPDSKQPDSKPNARSDSKPAKKPRQGERAAPVEGRETDSETRRRSDGGRKKAAPRKSEFTPDVVEWGDKAWQIFVAEVEEEGADLFGAKDEEQLVARCFELAKVFLDQRRKLTGR